MQQQGHYLPDADQLSLVSTFSDALEQLLPLSRLHDSPQEDDATWEEFESLGLFAIGLPEDQGGSGLGAVEEALIAAELGQRLASPSLLSSIAASHASREGAPAEVRRTAAACTNGDRSLLIEDGGAHQVLLRDGERTALYAYPDDAASLDEGLWHVPLCAFQPNSTPLAAFDGSGLQRLRLIDAAALSGIAQVAVSMAVAYAEVRKQFGRPIGSFQAVKHHCANMAIAARRARDLVAFAAVAVQDRRTDAELQVNCALLVAAEAALENSSLNIQVHGGMGFSAEADPHLLIKRTQVLIALAGGMETIRAMVADTAIPA